MKKNVSDFLKLFSVTLMLLILVPALSSAQTGKANFAGNWAFNAEKSTQPQGGGGGGRGFGGGDFVAAQEANLLTVTRTRTTQDGQTMTTVMKYTLDGKESVNTSQRGDSKSVATWSPDGKSLTIKTTRTMEFNGESRTINTTEVWSLTDPSTLSVVTTRPSQDGDVTTTMVYNKK